MEKPTAAKEPETLGGWRPAASRKTEVSEDDDGYEGDGFEGYSLDEITGNDDWLDDDNAEGDGDGTSLSADTNDAPSGSQAAALSDGDGGADGQDASGAGRPDGQDESGVGRPDGQDALGDFAAGETTNPARQSSEPVATTTTAAVETTQTSSAPQKQEGNLLKGITICLDPGHQQKQNNDQEPVAPDSSVKKAKVSSGTAGIATGDMEYELNLAVSLKLRALLEARGAKVVMTRTENNVDVSNVERAKIGNNAKADLAVRIHADGSTNRDTKGISMQIPSSKHVGAQLAETSKNAGQIVLNEVIKSTGARDRGLRARDDLTGFNWSTVPVILIEMGFMSNAEEDRLLASDEYRDKMAEGLCNGIVAYFNQ